MVSGADGSLNSEELDDLVKKSKQSDTKLTQPEESINDNLNTQLTEQSVIDNKTNTIKENINTSFDNTNLGLLLDVTMNVTVEIGRAKMKIEDVLKLGSGSIVELNKLNGEPVDIRVNNRLIGQGEVVSVDETFGIKILEIIELRKRINL